ncbi:rod-binding protein [Limnobacter humi]|uniref:Rod-binding protein n=1 Tax=Limnobacter humi TaxID=1778671 RepID=A0ABT1WKA4_9BURK|nr:rod-binding protein [Limnobacter humi]MCQ8897546.1 rod-binding protein [Limnobacter humi]
MASGDVGNNTAYWDSQGLSQLKRLSTGTPDQQRQAAKAAAQEFEALLLSELLKAAKAGEGTEDGLFSSDAMKSYQGMFNQQIAHSLAGKGLGFAQQIEQMILQFSAPKTVDPPDSQ